MAEHDFTHGRWGHNINILNWDKTARKGKAACWVVSGLKNGDIVLVRSENGSMKLRASEVVKAPNVDDMYIFTVSEISETTEEDLWVTKVKRRDGGYSILEVASEEKAQALADEFNEQHQTDNYYIEKYDKGRHAYSRHG
jgi:predicted RNase H-like nuclease (RuvC/YqgF family)